MEGAIKEEITVGLVGKVGNGKSASGNSILGRSLFETSSDTWSCTLNTSVGWTTREDIVVKVVDTPGVMDLNNNRELENIAIQIPEIMSVCPEGIHALC